MQLLNLFTVAGEAGDSFNTPWVPFPQDYDRAELWVECKMFTGSTVDIKLQTSMDTDDTNAQNRSSQCRGVHRHNPRRHLRVGPAEEGVGTRDHQFPKVRD
jgi:hypothetical protein